jgi:SnoaL-like domain
VSADHRAVMDTLVALLNRNDVTVVADTHSPDAVMEFPQSGEVFRGVANIRAQYENYPGGLPEGGLETADVSPDEPAFAVTPVFTVVAVEGSGNRGTATFRGTYPDGSIWWVIAFYRLEGGRIAHLTVYFAPEFEAPEWRAPYREAAAVRG